MHHQVLKSISILPLISILGCGDDIIYPPVGQFGNDTGIGDTGFIEHDLGAGMIEPGVCLTNEQAGGTAYGYQYMCDGWIAIIFEYAFNNSYYQHILPSSGTLEFGPMHDQYWAPRVMACCGEYNDNLDFEDQPEFALNCIMDAREQACESVMHALYKERNALPNGAQKDAVDEMVGYIKDHLTECIAGLHGTFPPQIFGFHTGTWTLPATWESQGLLGAELRYTVNVSGVDWPEYEYPSLMETCTSLRMNNDNIFKKPPSPLTYDVSTTLDEAEGSVLGPVYEGGRITASAEFTSASTSCTGPWCSHASFSEDSAGNWSIDEMSLFADGWFVVENGTLSETIDFGYVELSGSAPGTWEDVRGQRFYEVAAGDAHFVVGGRSGENATSLTAYNSTTIAAIQWAGEWYFGPFDVQYVDPTFGTFTLTVSESIWLEE